MRKRTIASCILSKIRHIAKRLHGTPFRAAALLSGNMRQNKENPADAAADERAVYANPQEILLHFIVDEPIELIVREAREDVADNDADERLRAERASRS